MHKFLKVLQWGLWVSIGQSAHCFKLVRWAGCLPTPSRHFNDGEAAAVQARVAILCRTAARRSIFNANLALGAHDRLAVERPAREPLSLTVSPRLRAPHSQLYLLLPVELELQLDRPGQHHVVVAHLVHHVRAAFHSVQRRRRLETIVGGAEATIQNVQTIYQSNVTVNSCFKHSATSKQ